MKYLFLGLLVLVVLSGCEPFMSWIEVKIEVIGNGTAQISFNTSDYGIQALPFEANKMICNNNTGWNDVTYYIDCSSINTIILNVYEDGILTYTETGNIIDYNFRGH
jgi:uncharacterized protein YceK